jgi:hypothetical protein
MILYMLAQPVPIVVYPFKHRRERDGKWVHARYIAGLDEIAARYAEWEITGPPENAPTAQGFVFAVAHDALDSPHVEANQTDDEARRREHGGDARRHDRATATAAGQADAQGAGIIATHARDAVADALERPTPGATLAVDTHHIAGRARTQQRADLPTLSPVLAYGPHGASQRRRE